MKIDYVTTLFIIFLSQMEDNQCIKMLVCWNEQAREISIKENDNLNTIEGNIYDTFQLPKIVHRYEYQIQYYHNEYEKYVDLYSETFDSFNQLKQRLSSSNVPKTSREWFLNIVRRTMPVIQSSMQKSITTDDDDDDNTYTFQQDDDPIVQKKHFISNTINDRFQTNIKKSKRKKQQNLPTTQSLQSPTIHNQYSTTHRHPYNLRFDSELADSQRLQYESEMTRTKSEKTTKAGVYVQARKQSSEASNDNISYPNVHFDIPESEQSLPWYLVFFVLTQAGTDGRHYIHASKYIYVSDAECNYDASNSTPDPFKVRLSQHEIHNGTHQVLLKVCNITKVSKLKHKRLEEFPSLDNPNIDDRAKYLSNNTTRSLKFSDEKYCLGCCLVRDGRKYDQCLSSMTCAVRAIKRATNNSQIEEQQLQQTSETDPKKFKQE